MICEGHHSLNITMLIINRKMNHVLYVLQWLTLHGYIAKNQKTETWLGPKSCIASKIDNPKLKFVASFLLY